MKPNRLQDFFILFRSDRTIQLLTLFIFVGTTLIFSINVYDSTILKLPILIIFSVLLILILARKTFEQPEFIFKFSSIDIAWAAYILASIISFITALNIYLGIERLIQLLCLYTIFCVCRTYFCSDTSRRQMTLIFIVVSAIACIIGLNQLFHIIPIGNQILTTDKPIISTFGNSTYFAGYLVLMLPFILSNVLIHIQQKKSLITQTGLLILLLTMIFLLIKTGSRIAWVASTTSGLLFIFLNIKRSRLRWMIVGIASTTVMLLLVFFSDMIGKQLETIIGYTPTSSIARRLTFYEGAWNAFLSSPIIGNGLGNFILFLPKFRSPNYWTSGAEDIVPHTHNEFLEILSETGSIGFVAFAAMMIILFIITYNVFKTCTSKIRLIMSGYLAGIVAVLIDNLASMNLRTIPVAVTFWMFLGLALHYVTVKEHNFSFQLPNIIKKIKFLPSIIFISFLSFYLPVTFDRYISEQFYLQGELLRWNNNVEESSIKFLKVIQHDHSNPQARLYLASNLASKYRYADARKHLDTLLKYYPFHPKARLVRSISAFEMGDIPQALDDLRKEMRINNSPQAQFYASYFDRRLMQKEDELVKIKLLLQKNIESSIGDYAAQAIERLSELCVDHPQQYMCLELLTKLSDTFPRDRGILIAIGDCFEEFQLLDEALSTYKKAAVLDLNNNYIINQIRNLEEKISKIDEAPMR
ncbi:MAG TPA: O-antigen ligase family protein [Bacteroidota bacterium]|nr:O-antigen ligase family protein [Bacteroidota bacterium]